MINLTIKLNEIAISATRFGEILKNFEFFESLLPSISQTFDFISEFVLLLGKFLLL